MKKIISIIIFLATCINGFSETREEMAQWIRNLKLQSGKVTLNNGSVTIDLPNQYRFIGEKDAKKILTDLWNNHPDKAVVGMIVHKDFLTDESGQWVVIIKDNPTGYISDKDASSIDYNDMMNGMKEKMPEMNKELKKKGYRTFDIIGWAEQPYYDESSHKLYWAKQIRAQDDDTDTLNYEVRILGRKNILELTAISNLNQFPDVKDKMPSILQSVNYEQGNRYVDFDPKIDKTAGYGLAALVAGGVAAKAGLFKGLLVALLAFKKVIIGAVIICLAFLKNLWDKLIGLFKGKKKLE